MLYRFFGKYIYRDNWTERIHAASHLLPFKVQTVFELPAKPPQQKVTKACYFVKWHVYFHPLYFLELLSVSTRETDIKLIAGRMNVFHFLLLAHH